MSINIQVITLSLTCVYNVIKVAIANPELQCSDTHTKVKNRAAEQKKTPCFCNRVFSSARGRESHVAWHI